MTRRLGGGVLATGLMLSSMSVLVAGSARADEVRGAITNVDLKETTADLSSTLNLGVTWQVPDGSKSGDTFSLTLPTELNALGDRGFTLKNDTGDVVANAVVRGRNVTFTLTDFAEKHTEVHGTAWFKVTFADSVKPGTTVPLRFAADGVVFPDQVAVTGTVGDYASSATKWQSWSDPAKESSSLPAADRILWAINGPRITKDRTNTTYTFTDYPGNGQRIDCNTISVYWGTSNSGGVSPTGWFGRDRYTKSCSPNELTIVLKTRADDEGHIPVVLGRSAVTTEGLSAYRNSAQVVIGNGGTWTTSHVLEVDAGGDGTGRTPTTPPTSNGGGTPPPTSPPTSNGGGTPPPTSPPTSNGGGTPPPSSGPTSFSSGVPVPPSASTGATTDYGSGQPTDPSSTAGATATNTAAGVPAQNGGGTPASAVPASGTAPNNAAAPGSPNRIDTGVPASTGPDGRLVGGGLALTALGGAALLAAGRRRRRTSTDA